MISYPISSAEGEHRFSEAYEQFERLVGTLNQEEAETLTHGAVEALIHTEGMELLRRLTQGYIDKRSEEEAVKDQVVVADGAARTHRREVCERRLETRFGEVIVKRWGYGGRVCLLKIGSCVKVDIELAPQIVYSDDVNHRLADISLLHPYPAIRWADVPVDLCSNQGLLFFA